MDPERERKAHEFTIRRSDELAAQWEGVEKGLRSRGAPPAELAEAFVGVVKGRIEAIVEGYLKHAIDEPLTKYDREFLALKATEEAERIVEHVREQFGRAIANHHRIALEAHAVDALKKFLDPV